MLGLPKNTEISKQFPKNGFFLKFGMNDKAQKSFDCDVSRMIVVNEVSVKSTNISKGETLSGFFVVHVLLKRKEFSEKNIAFISKSLPSKVLMVLEFDGNVTLAIYETKLLRNEWQPIENINITLQGLNFDEVWSNIVHTVQGGEWNRNLSVTENVEHQIEIERLKKEIERLKSKIKKEKQLNVQIKLNAELKMLKRKLEEHQCQ